eukprot:6192346-Pleurochrysis_carterae.AAC.2
MQGRRYQHTSSVKVLQSPPHCSAVLDARDLSPPMGVSVRPQQRRPAIDVAAAHRAAADSIARRGEHREPL